MKNNSTGFTEFEHQKFETCKKLRDYLKKKSPRLIKGWQKRYFIIVDNGNQLVWFKNNVNIKLLFKFIV